MECLNCLKSPFFICSCANVYLCEVHIGKHLIERHSYKCILEELKPDEKSSLTKKLKNWINSLIKLQTQVILKTNETLEIIENNSTLIIEKINSIIKNYQNILLKNQFPKSELEKIRSKLNLDLIITEPSFNNLNQEVKKTYSQDFHSFITDPIIENQEKINKFLQTHNGAFYCLTISRDGKTLVSGSEDTSVRVWNMVNKTQVACLTQHKSIVRCIALSDDCSFAVSGSLDKSLILWDLRNYCVKNVYKGHLSGVWTVALTQDCRFIVSGSCKKEIMLWRTDSNQCFSKIIANGQVFVGCINV